MTFLPTPIRSARAAVAATVPLAMLAGLFAVAPAAVAVAPDSAVFINELHYDNAGTDAGEFIEVAGPAGTDLTGWSIVLYNGGNNTSYDTDALSGTLADDTGTGFGFTSITYPANGIQNGDPDAVALVDDAGALVQFLSYEGTVAATNGPAMGTTSTDIGVREVGTEALGLSLQLTGTGDSYGDFSWAGPASQSVGAKNAGQTFVASGDPLPPTITCGSAVNTTTGTQATSPVSATDSDSGITSLAITSAPVAGITLAGSTAPSDAGEFATATLTVAGTTAVGIYQVKITATTDDAATAECTVTVTVTAPLATSLVSAVQGAGAASPLVGQKVQVEAIVTSLITSGDVLDGFFVQEENADADASPATSEGIYVFCGSACPSGLAAGDRVRVVGTVAEFFENTQINSTSGSVDILGSDLPTPTAAVVTLPASGSTEAPATFESVEGMVTTISTKLAVSEYFALAQFGEIVLTANEREFQYTQTDAPSVAGFQAFTADLATRRIVLDDASNDQNDATSGPQSNENYYYPTPGLSTGNYFRGGDTITGLTGAMEYSFGAWKLRPLPDEDYSFDVVNPRPAVPDAVGGRLKVASFNVLNYFATVDTTSSNNSGPCGPDGTDDCRGADSEQERQRQLAKIVAALKTIDADVFGLIEIQNDSGLATQQIVAALNAATAPGTYDYIVTGFIGTDAIKQAFLYKTATVTPVGAYDLLTSADDPRFVDTANRPALIQTFQEKATGERVTVAVNHLKSKGSECGAGDDSPDDGSGNCDLTRTKAAAALADYLAKDPTGSGDPDFLVIGDLNSYSMERPITTLEAAGYVDLLERSEGLESYGYVFDGLLGHLDHALATPSLARQVTGAGGWKINADESPLLDYNDDVKDVGEAVFERESSALPLYEPNPYRSSDHDPAIVGLNLAQSTQTALTLNVNPVVTGATTTATATVSSSRATPPTGTVEFLVNGAVVGTGTLDASGRATGVLTAPSSAGTYQVAARYVGDAVNLPSTSPPVNLVVNAPTTTPPPTPVEKVKTKIALKTPKRVNVGSGRGRVTFVVTASDSSITPSGKVRVKIVGAGKKKRVTVTLNYSGKGKVKLPKFTKTGRVTVRVKYLGDAACLTSSKVKRFRAVD